MAGGIAEWTGDIHEGDAADVARSLPESSVHAVVTSPPYWQQRDYDHTDQLGQEATPEEFVENLAGIFDAVRHALRDDGLACIVIDDSYQDRSLCGIPGRLAGLLRERGWRLVNTIAWAKPSGGAPSPVKDRLNGGHETILVVTPDSTDGCYLDQAAADWYGDVWTVSTARTSVAHTAVYPVALAARMLLAATPKSACAACGTPACTQYSPSRSLSERRIRHTIHDALLPEDESPGDLDAARQPLPVAVPSVAQLRAYQAAVYDDYTDTVDMDAAAAVSWFEDAYAETPMVARRLLGLGLDHQPVLECDCAAGATRPVVFDPFTGSGTTWVAAKQHDRSFVGAELNPDYIETALERVHGTLTTENRPDNQSSLAGWSA